MLAKVVWFDKVEGKGAARMSHGTLVNFDLSQVIDDTQVFYPSQVISVDIIETGRSPKISLEADDAMEHEHDWVKGRLGIRECYFCGRENE